MQRFSGFLVLLIRDLPQWKGGWGSGGDGGGVSSLQFVVLKRPLLLTK